MSRLFLALLGIAGFALLLPAADEPPNLLKPTPLAVNTEQDEDDPNLSSDGRKLYFVRAGKGKSEVYLAQRKGAGTPWGKAKAMIDLETKTANVRSPFVTAEGRFPQFLYYASDGDPEKKGQKGDNFDLYHRIKLTPRSDWTTETALAIGTAVDEIDPWLSPTGQHIFFSRKDKDGWHVYQSSRPAMGGQLGEPVKLDLPVNFYHATLTGDLKTMYLQGPLDEKAKKPRWGLFRSTKAGKGWSKPEPLTMLNHPEGRTGDRSPCLSRDGAYLYFASDRPGGKGGLDLYLIAASRLKNEK